MKQYVPYQYSKSGMRRTSSSEYTRRWLVKLSPEKLAEYRKKERIRQRENYRKRKETCHEERRAAASLGGNGISEAEEKTANQFVPVQPDMVEQKD